MLNSTRIRYKLEVSPNDHTRNSSLRADFSFYSVQRHRPDKPEQQKPGLCSQQKKIYTVEYHFLSLTGTRHCSVCNPGSFKIIGVSISLIQKSMQKSADCFLSFYFKNSSIFEYCAAQVQLWSTVSYTPKRISHDPVFTSLRRRSINDRQL